MRIRPWFCPYRWRAADRPGAMDGKRGPRGGYLSFLLRLWRVSVAGKPAWRVSLQRPGEAEQLVFVDLDEAVAFLRAEADEACGEDTTETEAPMR